MAEAMTEGRALTEGNIMDTAWSKALERKVTDPEGAVIISRTILESVCKYILDERFVEYNSKNADMSELYKLTAPWTGGAPR